MIAVHNHSPSQAQAQPAQVSSSSLISSSEKDRLEAIARRYDPTHDFDHTLSEYRANLVLQSFPGGRLLEVGCASGVMTRRFAARFARPGLFHVVEPSVRYCEQVRSIVGPNVTLHQCLAEEFEPSEPFDGVVFANLLEHVADPLNLLRRASTWLTPQGRLYVITPNARSLHRQVGVAMGILSDVYAFTDRDRMLGHRRIYDREQLASQLQQAGLLPEEWRGILVKIVSNAQIQSWPDPLVRALFQVGRDLPELSAQFFVRARKAGVDECA